MKKTTYSFLVWRIALFIPLILAQFLIPLRRGFDYTTPLHFIGLNNPLSHFLIYPWANFDGVYYLTIASSGYTVDNAGFFPLFPLLVKIFSLNAAGFSIFQYVVGLILTFAFSLLGFIFLYKLLKLDYKEETASKAIVLLLLFPSSFFFATIYPESLFFFLTILSFYFARKGNWLFASFFGLLLTATRIVGIAILPALLFEFYLQNKTLLSKKITIILLTPMGLLSYLYFCLINFGNALQFAKAQGGLHNNRSVENIILFPQTIFRYLKIFSTLHFSQYEWWIALLELFSFVFASFMLYLAWKKKIRVSYVLFSVLAFLIPASTGTFTGMPRYILILFPIFIVFALIKSKTIKIIYSIIAVILLFVLFMLFSKGYYVA